MDPAYANYALHRAGASTLAIAIGDNLLSKPWVADLMRLNKSFVLSGMSVVRGRCWRRPSCCLNISVTP